MPLGPSDLSFLVSEAPKPKPKPAAEVVEKKDDKAEPEAETPAQPPQEEESAEDAMAQQIRDDGTMDTGDSALFEEEE